MKMYYLGPNGSFTENAAQTYLQNIPERYEAQSCVTLHMVAQSVQSSDLATMAYYNKIDGLVQETLDLIYKNELFINASLRIPISFCAGKKPSTTKVNKIFAHPKGLAQTSHWIQKNYPEAELISAYSNSEAVQQVVKLEDALAIAGINAFNNSGLEVIAENIENVQDNYTDFYIVGKSKNENPDHQFTMIAISPEFDRVGLLADILNQFKYYDINIYKIHSRPDFNGLNGDNSTIKPQLFYLELMVNETAQAFIECIQSIRYKIGKNSVHNFGSYSIM